MNQNNENHPLHRRGRPGGVVALLTRPESRTGETINSANRNCSPISIPQWPPGLEFVQFDEDTSTLRAFKVAQVVSRKGKVRWSIPSHDNYPADAKNQLAERPRLLLGLKILYVVSDDPGDHAMLRRRRSVLQGTQAGQHRRGHAGDHERQGRQDAAVGDYRQAGAGQAGPALCPPRRRGPRLRRRVEDRQALHQVRRLDRKEPAEHEHLGHQAGVDQRLLGRSACGVP